MADFRAVTWPGVGTFLLTPPQVTVVVALMRAYLSDEAEVQEVALMDLVKGSVYEGGRLCEMFEGSPAFGLLVIPGRAGGTWKLAPLPVDE